MSNILSKTVSEIEQQLASFYGFALRVSASDHLVTKKDLLASLGPTVATQPEWQARAGVWLLSGDEASKDDFFIGIHIGDEIAESLAIADPRQGLDNSNLDAFCVVIEEISHFHLIVNRAIADRQVSKLELEYQGEIDKLLVCAMTLSQQAGDPHLLPLARLLYDQAIICSSNTTLYWEATKHAAQFWFDALRDHNTLTEELRGQMIALYHAPLEHKVGRLPKAS